VSRILVVDDDPDIRSLLGAWLRADGHVVEFAEDGARGAEVAARTQPDLVLTDFQMPRMDGFALFNAVRAAQQTSRVPVVMLTAHNSQALMLKALGPRRHQRRHDLGQLVPRDRLADEVVDAQAQGFLHQRTAVVRGDHDHRHLLFGVGAHRVEQREAVHPRHLEVGHDEVGHRGQRRTDPGDAVDREFDGVPVGFQVRSDQVPDIGVVVDYQDAAHGAAV